jgi:hypothetical protein
MVTNCNIINMYNINNSPHFGYIFRGHDFPTPHWLYSTEAEYIRAAKNRYYRYVCMLPRQNIRISSTARCPSIILSTCRFSNHKFRSSTSCRGLQTPAYSCFLQVWLGKKYFLQVYKHNEVWTFSKKKKITSLIHECPGLTPVSPREMGNKDPGRPETLGGSVKT